MTLSKTAFFPLPADIHPFILRRLDPPFLGRLCRVSRAYYERIAKDDSLWRDSTSSHYPELLKRDLFFWTESFLTTRTPSYTALPLKPREALQRGGLTSYKKLFNLFREFVEKMDYEPKRFTCRLAHRDQIFLSFSIGRHNSPDALKIDLISYLLFEKCALEAHPQVCIQKKWPEVAFTAECYVYYHNASKEGRKKTKRFALDCFKLLEKKKDSMMELHRKKIAKVERNSTLGFIALVIIVALWCVFEILRTKIPLILMV